MHQEEQTQAEIMKYIASHVKKEARTSQVSSTSDHVALPCYYVPFPANPNFYSRENILQDIYEQLHPSIRRHTFPSVALWAAAGVGKTQIALEYANRQRERGFKAIFWVPSEDPSEADKAFTEIAQVLKLSGATNSKGHDQNRLLVLRWLQQTSNVYCRPFIISF